MELTPQEMRVLACLLEKEATTPDQYPLSTNALVAACNQTTNRDPILHLDERTVDSAMLHLRELGLARTVRGAGHRTHKHRHVLDEALGLDRGELATLAVLMLRGAQTPGELRARTERYGGPDVDAALASLAARGEPLVRQLGRQPGQKEQRWIQLLADGAAEEEAASQVPPAAMPSAPHRSELDRPVAARVGPADADADAVDVELARLRGEVAELRGQVAHLYELLGEDPLGGDQR